MITYPRLLVSAAACVLATAALPAAVDLDLPRFVPARAPIVVHVRNLPELRQNWPQTPLAQTWNEPEVQQFFEPLLQTFSGRGGGTFSEEFQSHTGLSPTEVLDLFPGEIIFAMTDAGPLVGDEEDPPFILAAELGDNRAKFEEMLRTAQEKDPDQEVKEEFQGEELHVVMEAAEEGGEPQETIVWALVDDTFVLGRPKSAVQQAIALHNGASVGDTLAGVSQFNAIYERRAGAQISAYVGLDSLIPAIVEGMKAKQAAAANNGGGGGGMMNMPPDVLFHGFGLDALTSLQGSLQIGEEATEMDFGVSWSEQRGLLGLLAYGDPPVPRPSFIPDSWITVGVARFSFARAYQAAMDTLRQTIPAIEGIVRQQITNLNQQLGIDLERDFIGSIGDEVVTARALRDPSAAAANPLQPMDQLVAFSISNPDAFSRAIDALMQMSPGLAAQFKTREYLGTTIHTFTPPTAAGAATKANGFSYAVTPTYFLFGVGDSGMLETAVQGLDGASNSLWRKPEVQAALDRLPPGAISVQYTDIRRSVPMMLEMLKGIQKLAAKRQSASSEEEEGGEEGASDEKAAAAAAALESARLPSAEAIEKHWSTVTSASYLDPDGLHAYMRIEHAQ